MGAVQISQGQGLGRTDKNKYNYAGYAGQGYAVVGGVQFNTVYPLTRIQDAEAIGITEAADASNNKLVWYHLSEHFRLAPGVKTYLYVVDPTSKTLVQLTDPDTGPLPGVMNQIGGKAVVWGIFKNKASIAHTHGMDDDCYNAIAKLKALAVMQRGLNRPCLFVLEGRTLQSGASGATDLRASLADFVHVTVAQDLDYAALNTAWADSAAVGTVVGMKCAGRSSRNIGYVQECDIQDTVLGRWVNPGTSKGDAISTLDPDPETGDFKVFADKGYIIPQTYGTDSAPGVYFNDDASCGAATSDYYCMANAHVYCEAHRRVYEGVVPLVNMDVTVDPATGQLSPETCEIYESAGRQAIAPMTLGTPQARTISGSNVFCDPDQDIIENSAVQVDFEIVPKGYARTIKSTITFVKQLTTGI